MASACVNNLPTTSATSYTTYGWLSPRVSKSSSSPDFEFRLGDNATMLPADELISDGKLLPLQFSSSAKSVTPPPPTPPEMDKASCKGVSEDPYLFSPKAPRCSSRWRELLGLKKLNQTNTSSGQQQQPKTASSSSGPSTSSSSSTSASRSSSIRLFLNRKASSSSVDSSLSLPLLNKDSCSSSLDFESISMSSSRLSLSSSSSGHDLDELPRASLDAEKPMGHTHRSGPKVRTRPRTENPRVGRSTVRQESRNRGVSVDSPRMNPSGKVVFQSLERSSSSPSSFNGGPRYKHHSNRGVMERSYSANVHVRVTPVLNVPVCSLRGSSKSGVFGFAHLFSSSSSHSQKKEVSNNGVSKSYHHHHHHNNHSSSRNKKEEDREKECS